MSRDSSVQVLRKVAALLDRLAQDGEVSAARLAEQLSEPRSTVYRLLRSLEDLGYVEHGGRAGTYRLGLALLHLGAAVVSRFDERRAALAPMEHVHDQTGETVFLCVRRGSAAVCIERLEGARVQSLALRLGGSLPLHMGAAPRVLLAYAEPKAIDAYIEAAGREGQPGFDPEALRHELARIRETGLAISDEDVTVGISAVGAPVFDHAGEVRAALSISGVRRAILGEDSSRIRELLLHAAAETSRGLGFDTTRRATADA